VSTPAPSRRSIDEVLDDARRRLHRIGPERALLELHRGALLVDIRPDAQRRAEGEVAGSLVVERNVLEWRLDPRSDARIPRAGSYDLRVVVLCSEGYTSSLAAASLHDLGLTAATDVVGGVRAWAALGLPLVAGGTPAGQHVADRPHRIPPPAPTPS
jgi:rhodanese-related sulfurtransferase